MFVCLFVCYLFPSAEPNCHNDIWAHQWRWWGRAIVLWAALIDLTLDSFISWNCFSKFNEIGRNNEIARNNERAENNEIRKNQDFVQNWREIAFAHQCEIIIEISLNFYSKRKQILRNYCTIFVQIISIGNSNTRAQRDGLKRVKKKSKLPIHVIFLQCLCPWSFLWSKLWLIGLSVRDFTYL